MTSVALVVLDTLRKDAFEEHFDWLPGTRFERAYAPSHYTVPAHAALFTGRYPSEVGTHAKNHQFDPPVAPLAERLGDAGLDTYAFSANINVSRAFGWDRGFDQFRGSADTRHANATADVFEWNEFIRRHREEGPIRFPKAAWACLQSDCDTLPSLKHGAAIKYYNRTVEDSGASEALSFVRNTDFGDDAFLFCNLMEAHAPWDPPEEYRSVSLENFPGFVETVRGDDVDGERVRTAYDDAVRYLADVYEDVFESLREQFDVVITCSDHGEMLGERGIWGHGFGLDPELTHVPLVVTGIDGPDRREDVASLIDVHRTILELAGVDQSVGHRGRDLRTPGGDQAVLTEYLGLNAFRREALADADYAEAAAFDAERYGIALPTTYYGYETSGGFEGGEASERFRATGDADVDAPRARMTELVEDLDRADESTEGGMDDVGDAVMDDLEALGYA